MASIVLRTTLLAAVLLCVFCSVSTNGGSDFLVGGISEHFTGGPGLWVDLPKRGAGPFQEPEQQRGEKSERERRGVV